jgi:uncharacterized protein (TIGR00251 family)
MQIRETSEGTIMEIYVKPKSKEFKISFDNQEIVVFCREEPKAGKVNRELLKEFSKIFHGEVELVSGFSSKQKTLLIRGTPARDVLQVLEKLG